MYLCHLFSHIYTLWQSVWKRRLFVGRLFDLCLYFYMNYCISPFALRFEKGDVPFKRRRALWEVKFNALELRLRTFPSLWTPSSFSSPLLTLPVYIPLCLFPPFLWRMNHGGYSRRRRIDPSFPGLFYFCLLGVSFLVSFVLLSASYGLCFCFCFVSALVAVFAFSVFLECCCFFVIFL